MIGQAISQIEAAEGSGNSRHRLTALVGVVELDQEDWATDAKFHGADESGHAIGDAQGLVVHGEDDPVAGCESLDDGGLVAVDDFDIEAASVVDKSRRD